MRRVPWVRNVKVAAVIPAYNAGPLIEQTIRGFSNLVDWIIVVDDASQDETARRVEQLQLPHVVLLRHRENRGVGAAMKTGIQAALGREADIVVKVDADNQMDPAWLRPLLRPLLVGEAHVSKGNRWHDRQALARMPWVRRFGNLALGFLTRLASGHWHIFDPTNGYIAWRGDLLRRIDFRAVPDRYTFESGMLVETGLLGAVVRDVPIPARYGEEVSNLPVRLAPFQFSLYLARATLRRIWRQYFVLDFNAVSLFLLGGLLLTSFGILFGSWKWMESIRTGVPATAGTVILAAIPLVIGINFLIQALVLDIGSSLRRPPEPFRSGTLPARRRRRKVRRVRPPRP